MSISAVSNSEELNSAAAPAPSIYPASSADAASSPAPFRSPQSYHIVTYGCQMNDNDSEIMAGILEACGLSRAPSENEADVVLVNTCVVREGAEDRAIARIQNLAPLKRRNPDMIIGADFFLAHRIYVARSQGKIYFTYKGGPVFQNFAGDTPPQSGEAGAADATKQ